MTNRIPPTTANLESLTIVILTMNRPRQLSGVVQYWSKLPVKVIVADGSNLPSSFEKISNVIYLHSKTSYLDRMARAANLVDTEFVALCSDDEVFLPSGLQACLTYLANNSDFVAATGEAVGLIESGGDAQLTLQYPERQNFSLLEVDPILRAKNHLANYRVCGYYAVTRALEWKLIWQSLALEEFRPFAIQELQFEAALAFSGKMAVLPSLMWIRNNITSPIRGQGISGFDEKAQFGKWWVDSGSAQERNRLLAFTQRLFENLIRVRTNLERGSLDLRDVEQVYSGYYDWLLIHSGETKVRHSYLKRLSNIVRQIVVLSALYIRRDGVSHLLSRRAECNMEELTLATHTLITLRKNQ